MDIAEEEQKSNKLDVLAKDAVIALTIQGFGLVLTYVGQVFLARWMGKTEYGTYEYVISWSILLGIPAALGFPRTVLRLLSEYRVKEDWGHLRGLMRGSWLLTLWVGVLLGLGAAGVVWVLNSFHSFTYATPLLIGMALVPLQALTVLQLETARAMGDITLAYAPSKVIWPIWLLCGGFLLFDANPSLGSLPMIEVATLLLSAVLLLQLWLLREKIDREIEPATPVYSYQEWLGIAWVLLLQQSFGVILNRTDILMVGSIIGPSEAGIYNAAVKTAVWVSFILQVVNMVAAPVFATLYAKKDMQGLQKVVSRVTLWIFWPSIVLALGLIAFSKPVLSIFGPDFTAASWSLKILIVGQLVNALCGSVGNLMVMTGHQNKSVIVAGCSVLLNIVTNAIAIPVFGITGAAITTSFTIVVSNVWYSILVVKYVGVRPSVFYSLFNRGIVSES
ncbi:lipopolysaccharide biosynthesis protein [Microcoleus sp. OTE_8_concoct_300]|uniref:lipopolysaccharide biosynthesis protein n=1 Tax=Microcoleus sp. OTE_8_concoct_300 TaxID=2964710 RepID=UPI00403F7E9C